MAKCIVLSNAECQKSAKFDFKTLLMINKSPRIPLLELVIVIDSVLLMVNKKLQDKGGLKGGCFVFLL